MFAEPRRLCSDEQLDHGRADSLFADHGPRLRIETAMIRVRPMIERLLAILLRRLAPNIEEPCGSIWFERIMETAQ